MRYLVLTLITLMCSLGIFAQSSKVKQSTVDKLSENVKLNAIDPLDNEIQSLQNQILSIKLQIDRIKNRKFTKKTEGGNLQELFSDYESFDDIYKDRDYLLEQLESDNSDIAHAYNLAIKMKESLEKAYNEKTNTELMEEASTYKTVLPQHQSAFDELVSMVNDYNYYMFELARLFVAADEDNYRANAKELTDREDAPYLMNVPFTKKVLTEYIRKKGVLPYNYKKDLQNGCPDAFSELK